MGIQEWVRWSRTDLDSQERSRLMATLTAAQKRELVAKRYIWSKDVGVIWTAADGSLHRARFTHGRPFTTALGEFYINSGGSVWQISERPPNPATTPGLGAGIDSRGARLASGATGGACTSSPPRPGAPRGGSQEPRVIRVAP